MVSLNPSPGPVTQQDDKLANLEKALETIAKLEPKQKIRILSRPQFQIAPETRYWFSRKWTGDGCQPTIEIICQIMDECISLSALVNETSPETIKRRNARLKELYPLVLQGMRHLCDLYGSPEEKEYEAANGFAKRINVYVFSVRQIVGDCGSSNIPAPSEPCEILHIPRSIPYKVITGIALPAISTVCWVVSCYGTTLAAAKLVVEVANLGLLQNHRHSKIKLLLKAAQLMSDTDLL